MVWQLLWLALGGLLIGSLGRLAVPGPDPASWPRTLAVGVAGAVLGGLPAFAVTGRDHRVIAFAVAELIAALLVSGYALVRRSRAQSG
jgi:uncharacterized membrane protein YeaQ/YmgE (transglycosylase-associated protein family)